MKKGISFLYILLIFFSILLCTCKVSVEDTQLLRKPDVDLSAKQVTVIIPKVDSETDYINIYRKDNNAADDTQITIGLIFPQNTDEMTYRFIDTLVYEDSDYVYRVRYHNASGYEYSEWSNPIETEDINVGYAKSKKLTYEAGNARFIFDETDYTLTITDTITAPDITNFSNDFSPMLILSYDDVMQVFKIRKEALSQCEPITLRDRIPLNFMDKTITIEGILGQQTELVDPREEDENKQVPKLVRWTAPTSIKVVGHSDNSIYVPSSAEKAGFDYSRSVE